MVMTYTLSLYNFEAVVSVYAQWSMLMQRLRSINCYESFRLGLQTSLSKWASIFIFLKKRAFICSTHSVHKNYECEEDF